MMCQIADKEMGSEYEHQKRHQNLGPFVIVKCAGGSVVPCRIEPAV
jgi:hypothetical protein